MLLQLHSILCTLRFALLITGDFIPNVTKAHPEVSKERGVSYWGSFYPFGHSNTLMFHTEHSLLISFNNGAQWRIVDTIGTGAYSVLLDRFHTERAFVTCISGKIAVTEDAGKSWRDISLPEKISDGSRCSIETHSSRKNLLLLHCILFYMVISSSVSSRTKGRFTIFYGSHCLHLMTVERVLGILQLQLINVT
ncbi:hypothetical protein BZL39_F06240 [Zygosaccharomyces parabailii]|nr:hypothetical protein BZL39_F06240 [Zygosaccharomyces parabailii]